MRDRLAAGSPRGLGAAPEVVSEALTDLALLHELVQALNDPRPVVQNRAARALKKLQEAEPRALDSWAKPLLKATQACGDLRTRWNLLIVCGNLPLRGQLRAQAVDLMFESLNHVSALVRTFAMQGLVNFAREDAGLRRQLRPIVEAALENPSPAVRARARKLRRFV